MKVAARIGIAVPKSIQCSIQYIMRFSRTWTPLLNTQYIIFIFSVALYKITERERERQTERGRQRVVKAPPKVIQNC